MKVCAMFFAVYIMPEWGSNRNPGISTVRIIHALYCTAAMIGSEHLIAELLLV
jgi:hypothetical protein